MRKHTKPYFLICLLSLFVSMPAQAGDGLVIHHQQAYGFLFKYPQNWEWIQRLSSDRIATATSPTGIGRLTVRLHRYRYRGFRDGEEIFVAKYKQSTAAESNQFPSHHYHTFEDSISTYDFSVDTKKDLVDYEYRYRVLIFPEYYAAITLESVCAPEKSRADCALLARALRTFWVYNKEKFSKIFPSKFEVEQDALRGKPE